MYPLPKANNLIDRLKGAACFTKIYLRTSYHQTRIAEKDVFKTRLCMQYGHYEFLMLSFGLMNALATFQ